MSSHLECSISECVWDEHGLQFLAPRRNAHSKRIVELGRRKNGIRGRRADLGNSSVVIDITRWVSNGIHSWQRPSTEDQELNAMPHPKSL
jgi:hypothetical protein